MALKNNRNIEGNNNENINGNGNNNQHEEEENKYEYSLSEGLKNIRDLNLDFNFKCKYWTPVVVFVVRHDCSDCGECLLPNNDSCMECMFTIEHNFWCK